MHWMQVAEHTLLSLCMVIRVFHFLWFLIGPGWQCCIKTRGTQKWNPSALLLSYRKCLCFSLSLTITLPFDIPTCVLMEWMASRLRLGLDLGSPWDSTHWSQYQQGHRDRGAASGLPFPAGGFDVDRCSRRSTRETTGSRKWADDPSVPQDSANRNP